MAARVPEFVADVAAVLRFYSRLPVPALPGEDDPHGVPDFSRMARAVPLAGAVLGAIGALALAAAHGIGLSAFVAAAVAVAVLIVATGAFHEDGLADSADGLGGGATKERKLEIMKDSRIGSYGAAALVTALLLRAGSIAALVPLLGAGGTAAVLLAVAALSRTAPLAIFHALPPARVDGLSQAAGRPERPTLLVALVLAGFVTVVLAGPVVGAVPIALGLALVAVATVLLARMAAHHVGGQTGDVLGAGQQVAEIAFLLGVLISV